MLRFAVTAFGLPLLASFLITETSKRWPELQHKLGQAHSIMTDVSSAPSSSALSVAPHELSQPAFLWVTAETGDLCSDEEFNDWYSNEHVPIRLGHIPEFETGARYVANDGAKPTYSALYEVTDFSLFAHEKYTQLRANRSPREADLVKRLAELDRRTCKTVSDTGRVSPSAKETATFISTLFAEMTPDGDFEAFFNNVYLPKMRSVKGWRRTARHSVVDSLFMSAGQQPKANTAEQWLIVNEWDSEASATQAKETFPTASTPPQITRWTDRQWKLFKAWENTSRPPLNRVKPSYPPPGTSEIGDKIRLRRGTRGLTELDGALLNAPEIANGWNTLLGSVRNRNSLPGDVRELMILRVAVRNGAAYEWIHHEHVGIDEGLTVEQLVYLRDLTRLAPPVGSSHPFNELQAAAFALADESTRYSKIQDSTVDRLKAALAAQLPAGIPLAQQLTEAMVTTGTYNMVSRFLLAADVGQHAKIMTPLPAAHCQERTLYVAPGVTINAYIVRHNELKPWIVLVNSLMTDYTMWEGVMARLSKSYNILAYDQRGHGKSSIPPEPCTLDQLSDDIAMLLHQLGIKTPVRAVIGVSQGGATTLSFAIRHTAKFEKIIVCDTQIKSPEANRKAWDDRIELAKAKGMTALADATVPRWFPGGSPLAQGAQSHLVRPMVENTKLDGFIAGARALQGYDLSGSISAALKGKSALFIAGERDGKLPEGLKKLADQLKNEGNDAAFFEVPNAGHLPVFLDNGLQEWLDRVEPFLAA